MVIVRLLQGYFCLICSSRISIRTYHSDDARTFERALTASCTVLLLIGEFRTLIRHFATGTHVDSVEPPTVPLLDQLIEASIS
jgi:hypothetical protein